MQNEIAPVAEENVAGSESAVPTTSTIAAAAAAAATPTAVPSSVRIEVLLEECIKKNASDIHIQVGLPPILRVDGALQPIQNAPVLTEDMVEKLVFSTLDSMQREVLSKDKEFDYSFSFGDVARFRVNAFNEKGNLAAAFRLIPTKMPTIDELGMPQVVSTFADYPRGLVLVTGPTGSGKSTTLAALINKINMEKSVHIVTIEDPIEFTHKSKRSVIVQREVHYDTFSFARALKSALRQDPDVVLLGEMRDLETISSLQHFTLTQQHNLLTVWLMFSQQSNSHRFAHSFQQCLWRFVRSVLSQQLEVDVLWRQRLWLQTQQFAQLFVKERHTSSIQQSKLVQTRVCRQWIELLQNSFNRELLPMTMHVNMQ